MNLYNLAASSHPHLKVKWFTRHKELKYAKDMEGGWILYDNTGLKGQAAEWARKNLEEDAFTSSPVQKVITKLWTPMADGKETAVYEAELPECTHIVQAIGYKRDDLPRLTIKEHPEASPTPLATEHDNLNGRFFDKSKISIPTGESKNCNLDHIPGLFGAGIAFPEKVVDPLGNEEHAVGLWKFMRYLKEVVPDWVQKP